MNQMYEESVRHQVLVEGYKEEEQSSFYALLVPVLLKQFTDDLNASGVSSIRDLSWAQAKRRIKSTQSHQEREAKKNQNTLIAKMEAFAGSEYVFQQKQLEAEGLEVPERKTKRQAFALAEDEPVSSDGGSLNEFLTFWILAHSRRTGNALRRAWSEGRANVDVLREFRGTRARGYRNGILGSVLLRDMRYSIHNAIQHISSVTRLTAMRLSPSVQAYRWVSVLDSRTTAICRSLDGRVFDFGKGPRPPAHPGCRSTISPVINKKDPAPVRPSYYTWLKRQPASFQDEVLGKTRGKLFREGKISADRFAELNLNRNFKPRTLKEMHALEPVVFERAKLDV